MKKLSIALIVLCFCVGACTTTPGSNISSTQFASLLDTSSSSNVKASRVLITPDLIRGLGATDIQSPPSASQAAERYVYRVGAGDVLSVVVWDHPELTAPFGSFNRAQEQGNVVRDDGTIYYAFVGAVQAAGRTVLEIRDEMEGRWRSPARSPLPTFL